MACSCQVKTPWRTRISPTFYHVFISFCSTFWTLTSALLPEWITLRWYLDMCHCRILFIGTDLRAKINIIGTVKEFLHSLKILHCKNTGSKDTNCTTCRWQKYLLTLFYIYIQTVSQSGKTIKSMTVISVWLLIFTLQVMIAFIKHLNYRIQDCMFHSLQVLDGINTVTHLRGDTYLCLYFYKE
jgi:hypothetical protein